MAQMVVASDQNALCSKVLGQRFVTVNEFHHAVGKLQDGAHIAIRHTAERVQRPPRNGGRHGEIDHLRHNSSSFPAGL